MSRSIPSSIVQLAVAAAACAMATLALRYVVAHPDEDALREFLVVTGMIVVSTAIVFGVVIPRALASGASAGVALTLSLLGLLLAAAYWSGLPPVLAIGGVVLGLRSSDREQTGTARAAVGFGVVALIADLAVLIADAMSR